MITLESHLFSVLGGIVFHQSHIGLFLVVGHVPFETRTFVEKKNEGDSNTLDIPGFCLVH